MIKSTWAHRNRQVLPVERSRLVPSNAPTSSARLWLDVFDANAKAASSDPEHRIFLGSNDMPAVRYVFDEREASRLEGILLFRLPRLSDRKHPRYSRGD
jgi:hypothetical protein